MKVLNEQKMRVADCFKDWHKNETEDHTKNEIENYQKLVILHNSYLSLYETINENPITKKIYDKYYMEWLTDPNRLNNEEPKIYLIKKTILAMIDILSEKETSKKVDLESEKSENSTEDLCLCICCKKKFPDDKIFRLAKDPSKGLCFNCY